jgi:hypothetical protein
LETPGHSTGERSGDGAHRGEKDSGIVLGSIIYPGIRAQKRQQRECHEHDPKADYMCSCEIILHLSLVANIILSDAPECVQEEIFVGDFLFDLHPNRNPHPNHNRFALPVD